MSYTFSKNLRISNNHHFYGLKEDLIVDIKDVVTCKYDDPYKKYLIVCKDGSYVITTPRLPDFEAMFPKFPYYVNKPVGERLEKLEREMAIVLSHIEAISVFLKIRLPTDDPLDSFT